jgi:hypothetical protein
MVIEFGIMSSKWSIEVDEVLVGIAAICIYLQSNAKLCMIYSPDDVREKYNLFSIGTDETLTDKINKWYVSMEAFNKYVEKHAEELQKAFKTLKKLV